MSSRKTKSHQFLLTLEEPLLITFEQHAYLVRYIVQKVGLKVISYSDDKAIAIRGKFLSTLRD